MTTTDATTTTDPATATPAAVIQRLYEAFGRGDMPAILDAIDPEVDWSAQIDAPGAELVPMFQNGRGHDAVLRYFGGVADLEFHMFEPRAFYVDGDVVLVELVLDFSHRTTGKRAHVDEIHRFVVREGRVVHYRPYADTAAIIEAFRA